MLFETRFYKNVLFVQRKVHIAKMYVCFEMSSLLIFCTVFSTICGTVVKK